MTRAEKNALAGRIEFALMSRSALRVPDKDSLRYAVEYVLNMLVSTHAISENVWTVDSILEEANRYNSENRATTHISFDSTEFGFLFTFVREYEDAIDSPNGCLAYVVNLTCPECSELGYVFYQKRDPGIYCRVG